MLKAAFFVCAFVGFVNAKSLPSGIKTCKKSDPDYKNCIIHAVEDSIIYLIKNSKELNMPSMDPVHVPKIFIPGSGGSVDVEETYTDLKISGFDNIKLSNVNIDIDGDNCKMDMRLVAPHVELIGQLKLVGKLMLLTLGGTSPANITIVNLDMKIDFTCKKIQKGEDTYLDITNTMIDMNTDKLVFDVKNLVDGNKELSLNVEQVLNDNHREIYAEVKHEYDAAFREVVHSLANSFFRKVPANDVFLP